MRDKLKRLLVNAYAPYSNFKVAAIIETNDNKFIPGVNVENASYGATICAERNAITTAISMGYKKGNFKSISIMVSGDKLSTPCFICRQLIIEFFSLDAKVYLYNETDVKEYSVSELCPYPFTENDL